MFCLSQLTALVYALDMTFHKDALTYTENVIRKTYNSVMFSVFPEILVSK